MSQAAPATTSTPGRDLVPDTTGLFTTAHLVWIALFAAVVVLAIVWGIRQKAKRKAAEREIAAHNADLGDAAPPPPPPPPPAAAVPPPRPLPVTQPDVAPLGGSPAPVAAGPADGSVTQLKGLGPKVAERLAQLGITTVGQIAALTDDQAADLDAQLGAFAGRMGRDRWQEQARFLAAGDRAGFEAVFGKL